ncbi:alpha/beta fold hydrolase [Pseudoduganella ginsengisoli]|nr:alpha/beta fold hydrolase [Pseudoduganella ginsengisoli]
MADGAHAARWLRHFGPSSAHAGANLVCLPHAGAGAFQFASWARPLAGLAHVVAVQLPGREDRVGEPCMTGSAALVEQVAAALAALPPRPLVLYGHSMGASLAHALTQRLRRDGVPVRALLVSGQVPPHATRSRPPLDTPDALLAWLRALDGMPAAVLANDELMALWLPTAWADMQLLDDCFAVANAAAPVRIDVPLTALAGSGDWLAPPERVARWRDCTSAAFHGATLEGGHFFPQNQPAAMLAEVRAALLRALAGITQLADNYYS